jgi:hypothetical protein
MFVDFWYLQLKFELPFFCSSLPLTSSVSPSFLLTVYFSFIFFVSSGSSFFIKYIFILVLGSLSTFHLSRCWSFLNHSTTSPFTVFRFVLIQSSILYMYIIYAKRLCCSKLDFQLLFGPSDYENLVPVCHLSFCMHAYMYVCMNLWICTSLAPERLGGFYLYSIFKSLCFIGQCPTLQMGDVQKGLKREWQLPRNGSNYFYFF